MSVHSKNPSPFAPIGQCPSCVHMIPRNEDMWPSDSLHCAGFGKNLLVLVLPKINIGYETCCSPFTKRKDMWLQVAGALQGQLQRKMPYPACEDVALPDKPCPAFQLKTAQLHPPVQD